MLLALVFVYFIRKYYNIFKRWGPGCLIMTNMKEIVHCSSWTGGFFTSLSLDPPVLSVYVPLQTFCILLLLDKLTRVISAQCLYPNGEFFLINNMVAYKIHIKNLLYGFSCFNSIYTFSSIVYYCLFIKYCFIFLPF